MSLITQQKLANINNMLPMLQPYDIHGHVNIMALIDECFYSSDTVCTYNTRLRTSVKNNFNKICLTAAQIELFKIWDANLMSISINASRDEIFAAGSLEALHIVGF